MGCRYTDSRYTFGRYSPSFSGFLRQGTPAAVIGSSVSRPGSVQSLVFRLLMPRSAYSSGLSSALDAAGQRPNATGLQLGGGKLCSATELPQERSLRIMARWAGQSRVADAAGTRRMSDGWAERRQAASGSVGRRQAAVRCQPDGQDRSVGSLREVR